ncbi:MAG: hypothetical protein HYV29_07740 [Ignavibacteriales bacterium]|nr:hypothetical protein [Ignavibacteriales bacterium]
MRVWVRDQLRGKRESGKAAIPVPWVTSHSATHLFYKSYFPRKLKQLIAGYGFTVADEMSLGYELRTARRLGFFSNALLISIEEALERFTRSFSIPPFKYAGDTYSILFQKNTTEGMQGV